MSYTPSAIQRVPNRERRTPLRTSEILAFLKECENALLHGISPSVWTRYRPEYTASIKAPRESALPQELGVEVGKQAALQQAVVAKVNAWHYVFRVKHHLSNPALKGGADGIYDNTSGLRPYTTSGVLILPMLLDGSIAPPEQAKHEANPAHYQERL